MLNVAAMQLVNWLATPIQFALVLPFYRAGAHLAGLTPLSASSADLLASFRTDPAGLFAAIGSQMLAGTLLWLVVALPAVWVFARLFLALLQRLIPRANGMHPVETLHVSAVARRAKEDATSLQGVAQTKQAASHCLRGMSRPIIKQAT